MKRCPECRRDYYDETLLYCLDDGTALLEGPASMDEPATAMLPDAHTTSDARTRTFDGRTEREEKATSKWNLIVAATVGVLIVTALGIGSYFYYGRSASEISSIAVLPFVNEGGDPEMEYLSDGMTETLINNLSQLPNLSVKARSSVFSYKGKNTAPQQVGSELSVQAVLNGRLLQRGENLTLSVELVDARTGDQIWGEQYNRKLVDLIALQGEIARDVSGKLQQRLSRAARKDVAKNPTSDPEAYQLYLKGLFHWNKRTGDDLKKAIDYFNQAKERDPSFALAYAGIAVTYSVLPSNTLMTKEDVNEANLKARATAVRAMELDNSIAEPHAVLAISKIAEWDFAGSEREFKKAIELNPNYATARQWYSELLSRLTRHDEALAEIKKAYELDPFSTAVNMNVALRNSQIGRTEEAIVYFKKTIELSPEYPMAYLYLSDHYFERGMYEESLAMGAKGSILLKIDLPERAEQKTEELRRTLKKEGVKGYWRKMLEYEMELYEKGLSSPVYLAGLYAELGETDKAFRWLEKAYSERDYGLTYLKTDRRLRSIYSDPRYQDLVRRVGLPL